MLNNENKKWGLSRINEFTNSCTCGRSEINKCSCTLTAMLRVSRSACGGQRLQQPTLD